MILYCNNCCIKNGREGKDHEEKHGRRAFFDLWYEPEEKHIANLDENLRPGLECIVATRQRGQITFRWYSFIKEKPGTIDGKSCRVFYGDRVRVSGTHSKADAARLQPIFFNSAGNFNQWKALIR